MADRFQNGLLLTTPTAGQVGRTFSRWLFEFATQICGWTARDSYSIGSGSYTATRGTGANGASVAGEPQQLDITGDAYNFAAGTDEGRYLTLTNFAADSADRNGIYRIVNVVSAKIVELDIRFSVHDAGIPHPSASLAWRLWGPEAADIPSHNAGNYGVIRGVGTTGGGYSFDVRFKQKTTLSDFPEYQVGPIPASPWTIGAPGSWPDAKQTTLYSIQVGDSDRITVCIREMDNVKIWDWVYLGEMDAFYSNVIDPNPCLIWQGHNDTGDKKNVFGVALSTATFFYNGGRGLAEDDLTTIPYFPMFFQTSPTASSITMVQGLQRRWSQRTRRIYRQAMIVESQTAGHMELRGTLRRCWVGGQDLLRGTPFGRNAEFLHIVGGLIFPWNGSGVHEQRV